MDVSPTKSNLLATKRALALAREGYTLLNRKRNVLVREMMQRIDEARSIQDSMETVFARAYQGLQNANLSMGIENVQEIALSVEEADYLQIHLRSVMGVEVPGVAAIETEITPSYGFVSTNANLDMAAKAFKRALSLIGRLSEIEISIYRLAMEIRKTQKRVNALENILIPRYQETIRFIVAAIEEAERDDFFRMKRLKSRQSAEGE